jgi:hypothetical protein
MSSSIWTECAGDSEIRPLRLEPWRVVESQHQVSTRKLVDSGAEQELLERLIDRVKPPAPPPARGAPRQHYLLTTPFRYPPLRHGSRFGTRHERGIWYGSETLTTAFAEVAYYRMVFLEGTSAGLGPVTTELSAFRAVAKTRRGVDLTAKRFSRHRSAIASPVSYGETQALGAAMRAAGVTLIRYQSARDPAGINVAAFAPEVFGKAVPKHFERWQCILTRDVVELVRREYTGRAAHACARSMFEVDGRLPLPAL